MTITRDEREKLVLPPEIMKNSTSDEKYYFAAAARKRQALGIANGVPTQNGTEGANAASENKTENNTEGVTAGAENKDSSNNESRKSSAETKKKTEEKKEDEEEPESTWTDRCLPCSRVTWLPTATRDVDGHIDWIFVKASKHCSKLKFTRSPEVIEAIQKSYELPQASDHALEAYTLVLE